MKEHSDQYIDIKKLIGVLRKKAHYYAIALLLCVVIAFLAGKMIAPIYQVASSIYIKENSSMKGQKTVEFLQSFQLFDQSRHFQNEMLVLKSSPLVRETIDQLNFEIEYYADGTWIDRELYKESPFVVLYDSIHPQMVDVPVSIVFHEDGKLTVSASASEYSVINYSTGKVKKAKQTVELQTTCFQSDMLEDDAYKFQVYLKEPNKLPQIQGREFHFVFRNKEKLVREIQKNLSVSPENPEVSIIRLSLETTYREKGLDFITALTDLYLQKNLERKNHFALNTIAYINQQLDEISDSLNVAEKQLESFRAGNQVIDISSKAGRIFEQLHQIELERSTIDRQLQYYNYLNEFFEDDDNLADLVVPSSMGISDQTLNELIRNLIILVNQRNELIGKKQQKSPYLKNLEVQIESLKNPISENIQFSIGTLESALANLDAKIYELKTNLKALPETERQLVGFERKFKLNDAIYTFLLQRRAEAQIAKASNLPEHEIVEPAQVMTRVYPNNMINYGLAIFMGLLLPSLLIIVMSYFDGRVKSEDDLADYKDIPFMGSILHHPSEHSDVVMKLPSEAIAETFRTLRTNLSFSLQGEAHKTILVTSSISGEGKSFVALNLALSLSQLNKKVLLLGFDLRKNNQFREQVKDASLGLTSLYVHRATLDEVIQKSEQYNIDVISSGLVPPNPMELINSSVTDSVFASLKKNYDYIVVDTSPVGVVSDGLLLMKYADLKLFVVRENYSQRAVVKTVIDELKEKGIDKIGIVLNASRMEGKKYKYEYYDSYRLGALDNS
ncbi:GumC family protein [Carboxylicivirga taeanensis]|uniref:GumC family protein n=1 Tax=Carboxylicivirga taeanensis TaxID=1416875 RepID=UPI003F6E333F